MTVPFLVALGAALALALPAPGQTPETPPAPRREFRGVWVASVANIDWPSKPGLPVEQQKAELVALLDRARALHLNAVVFQVRPACDALYESNLEPWSEYLTGVMGKAPEPFYDPLAFAVAEAHQRGLELHAWFNPYRARQYGAKSAIADSHISRTHPELVRRYGRLLWLDPGEPDVQNHSLAVVMDVVRRYDIDGVHIDDYFYPYKEKNPKTGALLPFPDEASYRRYKGQGGTLARDDWRRDNVNRFVERLYQEVKAAKPWVKVGISPFGIWRPGNPPQIRGFDAFTELYADARRWLLEGWCDYFAPQLYWRIEQRAQSFPALLAWWASQNGQRRHLWPGSIPSRVAEGAWPATEIEYQVRTARGLAGVGGNIHFSMASLMRGGVEERKSLPGRLLATVYEAPALVPASPWLGDAPPDAPTVRLEGSEIVWTPGAAGAAFVWCVQTRIDKGWKVDVVPADQRRLPLPEKCTAVAVTAVDRLGNASAPTLVPLVTASSGSGSGTK